VADDDQHVDDEQQEGAEMDHEPRPSKPSKSKQRAPADPDQHPHDDDADPPSQPDGSSPRKPLTSERLAALVEAATERKSFKGFQNLLAAYRSVVRLLSGEVDSEGSELHPHAADETLARALEDKHAKKAKGRGVEQGGAGGKKTAPKPETKKPVRTAYSIDDSAVIDETIRLVLAHAAEMFEYHAGGGDAATGEIKRGKKRSGKSSDGPGLGNVPSQLPRWSRVELLARTFWTETVTLCEACGMAGNTEANKKLFEEVLTRVGDLRLLVLVSPFERLLKRLLKETVRCWAFNTAHRCRLAAFILCRNWAALASHFQENNKAKDARAAFGAKDVVQLLCRGFAAAVGRGYTWRNVSTVQFLENCIVELLRADDALAHTVALSNVRQLGFLVRSACVAGSHAGEGGKEVSDKTKKRKQHLWQERSTALYSWVFLCQCRLWATAIVQLPALRPLAMPLYTVVTAALKTKTSSLVYAPYSLHLVGIVNDLASGLELFFPAVTFVFDVTQSLLLQLDKAVRSRAPTAAPASGAGGGPRKVSPGVGASKGSDMAVALRFAPAHLKLIQTLESLADEIIFVLVDHLGSLSRHPAFPEMSVAVTFQLKKYLKQSKSDSFRRQLKDLLRTIDETATLIKQKRLQMDHKQLHAFLDQKKATVAYYDGTDLPLFQKRERMLSERREAFRQKIAADAQGRQIKQEEQDAEAPLSKRQLKRKRQKEKRTAAAEDEEEAAPGRKASIKIEEQDADEAQGVSKEEDGEEGDHDERPKKKRKKAAARAPAPAPGAEGVGADLVDGDIVEEFRISDDDD